jgi:glycine cleavage system T protein (aminomethyltransferase)
LISEQLQQTPLYDTHVAFGAKMVPFAGWELPVQFAGILAEHNHTRTACSVFDVSHMGRLKLIGGDCEKFLDHLCTRKLAGAEVGRSYYSHICREDGGILDDVIVSRFEEHWGIVCNASNRDKIVAWIEKHRAGHDVELTDQTTATAMIACQGPKTMEVAEQFGAGDISSLKRYRFTVRQVGPIAITIYRCGYTGEDGVEVVVPAGLVGMLVPKLLGTKNSPHPLVRPAGLGSRDTLRIEAAMPLYGHELSEDWDSLTAGQSWCVDLSRDFIGSEAMRAVKEQGVPRRLVGLQLEGRRIARQHAAVYRGGEAIGEVTSGTLSPTLGTSIAMGFLPAEASEVGTTVEVAVGSKRTGATVVKLPFYKRG